MSAQLRQDRQDQVGTLGDDLSAILLGAGQVAARQRDQIGRRDRQIDPGTAAVVGSIVGAAVQWIMANAQQANGFFFGSSPGSRAKDMELGRAAAEGVKRAAKG